MPSLRKKILKSNIEEHKKEARYYDLIHSEIYNSFEQKRVDLSLERLTKKLNKNIIILEVGPGTGNVTIKLIKKGFHKITAVDISKEMLKQLQKKTNLCNKNIVCADIDSFVKNTINKYDLIIISSVLHHLPNYNKTINHLCKLLKENGIIYITHEPFYKKNNFSSKEYHLLSALIKKVDYLVYLIRYVILIIFGKLKYLNRDCYYSDFHTGEKAINLSNFINLLKNKGFTVDKKLFATAKFSIFSYLLNKLRLYDNFELIVSKNA